MEVKCCSKSLQSHITCLDTKTPEAERSETERTEGAEASKAGERLSPGEERDLLMKDLDTITTMTADGGK